MATASRHYPTFTYGAFGRAVHAFYTARDGGEAPRSVCNAVKRPKSSRQFDAFYVSRLMADNGKCLECEQLVDALLPIVLEEQRAAR
jgi:hypothetical protein